MQRATRQNTRRKIRHPFGTSGTPQELLRRVRAAVLADPLILDMDDYFFQRGAQKSYCIATLTLVLAGYDVESVLDPHEEARNVLELSSRAAKSLFLVSGWPEDLQRGYVREPITRSDYRHNADVTARRLERLCRMVR